MLLVVPLVVLTSKPVGVWGIQVIISQQFMPAQLTPGSAVSGVHGVEWLLLAVIVLLGGAVGVLLHRLNQLSTGTTTPLTPSPPTETPTESPTDEQTMPACDELPSEEDAQQVTGAGPILARLSELCQDFTLATQEVRYYSGTREVQLQNWQRLCTDILRRVLPVLENIEPFLRDEHEGVAELAQLMHGRLLTELMSIGVRLITPEPGEPFDAMYHQLHPDTTGLPPYQVKRTASPGFIFRPRVTGAGDVVLKPAEVVAETVVVDIPISDIDDRPTIILPLPGEAADESSEEPMEEVHPPLGGYDVLITPLFVDESEGNGEQALVVLEDESTQDVVLPVIEDESELLWMHDELEQTRVWDVDQDEEHVQ